MKSFFYAIGGRCLLSLSSSLPRRVVWQHHRHHSSDSSCAPHKRHNSILFRTPPPPPFMLRVVSVKPSASKIVLQLCFRARYMDICLCVYVRVFLSLLISLCLNLSFCRSFCVSVLPDIFWWVSKQCPVVLLLALLADVASSFALFFR
jgi:hypothetical protein